MKRPQKKKGIISLDYSQNNSKDTRILTIYTRNVLNILRITITVVLAATCESENKYDTFIYVERFVTYESHVRRNNY